jgi:hypothetical protein
VAREEFASHRAQIERLLELADEYDLSGMDRDKLRHAADDKPVEHFDDERARGLAKRLAARGVRLCTIVRLDAGGYPDRCVRALEAR